MATNEAININYVTMQQAGIRVNLPKIKGLTMVELSNEIVVSGNFKGEVMDDFKKLVEKQYNTRLD